MKRISTATRLSLGLVALTLSVLSTTQLLGIYPDPTQAKLDGRLKLCEAIGIHSASAVRNDEVDIDALSAVTSSMVAQNPQVISVGVRNVEGVLLVQSGDHEASWAAGAEPDKSTPTHVRIPIIRGGEKWGEVEVQFEPLYGGGFWWWLKHPIVGTMVFMGVSGFVAYLFYLRRTLKVLNPQSVIPSRIQAMLNTMTEGIVVLDKDEQIVMVNEAFVKTVGGTTANLQGKKITSLGWQQEEADDEEETAEYPWTKAINEGKTQVGVALKHKTSDEDEITLMVNAAPILGTDGKARGALTTFDDVTAVEKKNVQLNDLVSMLKDSRDQISEQNKQLERLATRDALTGCLNRRSLFTQFDSLWNMANDSGKDIGCIMFDIDKFKSINDNHGHAKGDQVLREIAEVLKTTADEMDIVCRYGGEEFCILMRNAGVDQATETAERFRKAIEDRRAGDLPVTSSFGVSAKSMGASSPQDLLDQSDQALYAAKHGGRNRVERFDQLPEAPAEPEKDDRGEGGHVVAGPQPKRLDEPESDTFIPFQAAAGLLAALSHRDAATGQHSKRVGDLCVMVGKELMSARDCFVLEVAALLHDLGKLGIPDAILLKPGELTEEEWHVMHLHDEMGVAIVTATFASKELTDVIRLHHAWYDGNPSRTDLPKGRDIPLMARVLSIADAYDAMTSDRPYRKARSQDEAFAELRRCAGTQFDPDLIERFIEVVTDIYRRERTDLGPATGQLALELGQAIDRLTTAIEDDKFASIPVIAAQLKFAAARDGSGRIVELADNLEKISASGADLGHITDVISELLKLCNTVSQARNDPADTHPRTL